MTVAGVLVALLTWLGATAVALCGLLLLSSGYRQDDSVQIAGGGMLVGGIAGLAIHVLFF